MTTTTANTDFTERRPSILSRIGAAFFAFAEKQGRTKQVAELRALSDEDLAARGLSRDTIVHHVFSDKLHL